MLVDLNELSTPGYQKNLRETFPISPLKVVRVSIVWILFYILSTAVMLLVLSSIKPVLDPLSGFTYSVGLFVIIAGGIICLAKLIYEAIYYKLFEYHIEDGNIVVTEGIFFKERGMFPISTISDVYLERNFLDLFFGLYNIHITNPGAESHHFGDIRGLTPENAVGFQDYLKNLINAVSPQNRKAKAVNPEDYEISPEEK